MEGSSEVFDVLDPKLDLYQRFFIEASAGCGKTFSIENAYIRLLLDSKRGFNPQNILVLTFTRESTQELRMRIRLAIENAIYEMEHPKKAKLPFILEFLSQNESDQRASLQNLLDAHAGFDQAEILTLHSFCFRMLQENLFEARLSIEEDFKDEGPSLQRVEQVFKDFLSYKLDSSLFCSSQIRLLLKYYKNDFSLLLRKGIHELSKEMPSLEFISFEAQSKEVKALLENLKTGLNLDEDKVLKDLEHQVSFYKGGKSRAGVIHPEIIQMLLSFSKLIGDRDLKDLNSFLWHAEPFFNFFSEENLKKKASSEDVKLFYPDLLQTLQSQLKPLIFTLVDPKYILSNLISYAQKLYQTRLNAERSLSPNQIIERFSKLSEDPVIAQKIAFHYEAVIVDEFQDTDPIQWKILSSIFLKYRSKDHPFYVVGDPKQSIYAFRQADIYTYLTAAKALGPKAHRTLHTNYRSQPHLISALNSLFHAINPNWIALPKWKQILPYKPVLSSPSIEKKDFGDGKEPLHFFIAHEKKRALSVPSKEIEEEMLFPFIANEILTLHIEKQIPLSSFAILVRDRFQATRLKQFLKEHQIAYQSARPEPLKGSKIASYFLELYEAVLEPKKISKIQKLKLNPLFNVFSSLDEESWLKVMMSHFAQMKKILFERGFLPFYHALMLQPLEQKSLYEHLLSLEEGLYYYLELEQIKDLMVEEEVKGFNPEKLLEFLTQLTESSYLLENTIPQRQNVDDEAVQILTLHLCKGLEFEVVFALGLVNRTPQKEDLFAYEAENQRILAPTSYCSMSYQAYLDELYAEKFRQLYVALTRAKQRLYLPVLFASLASQDKSSPMEAFLDTLGLDENKLISFVDQNPHMSISRLDHKLEVSNSVKAKEVELTEPSQIELHLQKHFHHSFTSLSSGENHRMLDLKAPHDFEAEEKTIHTLPAGPQTGELFHKIFEEINFQEEVKVEPFLRNTPYVSWENVIQSQMDAVLNLEIQVGATDSFRLKDLPKEDVFKEIEFLYPLLEEELKKVKIQSGDFLGGFVDLIFKYNNKYYLMDYKTNWLGPSTESYLHLHEVMTQHQYDLQAQIYKKALQKYLQIFDSRSFEECFGGMYYLFIRGIGAENQGIILV